MDDLITALNIFRKYGNPTFPTHCEHDEMFAMIEPSLVSDEDVRKLEALGFSPKDGEYFTSSRFGSA